jgi:hypothetical protein
MAQLILKKKNDHNKNKNKHWRESSGRHRYHFYGWIYFGRNWF